MDRKDKKKRKWIDKLRSKYRLVFITDDTLEERFTFRLSRLNVFVALGTLTIILIFLTSILIAFTPLREYIPGYTNVGLTKKLYQLQARTDSIEHLLAMKERFMQNIKDVISGKDLSDQKPLVRDTMKRYDKIKLKRSEEDSLLREEIDNQSRYNLNRLDSRETSTVKKTSIGGLLFFTPLKGVVTNNFDFASKHYGVDIVSKQNEAVKAVLDGTVIFTNWTLENGFVISVQHAGNLISIYKHNSAILKKAGDIVSAGEPIAIVGETGELSTGPHLHFELWNDGSPVNPKDYITF
ncbi:MAG: M23 family metallopeptidase [Bacteroidetes bacterium]|nr:M23 family metallopeptidase [Bacteroidota bacterium]